jgi:hypothetical protein
MKSQRSRTNLLDIMAILCVIAGLLFGIGPCACWMGAEVETQE